MREWLISIRYRSFGCCGCRCELPEFSEVLLASFAVHARRHAFFSFSPRSEREESESFCKLYGSLGELLAERCSQLFLENFKYFFRLPASGPRNRNGWLNNDA